MLLHIVVQQLRVVLVEEEVEVEVEVAVVVVALEIYSSTRERGVGR
jgi:hypothetical protein